MGNCESRNAGTERGTDVMFLVSYISDYTSRKTFIIIKADVSAPMQVPSSVQMTKTDRTVV